ncbi:MAG: hypothetical protein M3203_12765 [Actinomycetota bacterium]|nr:hypothetical protein [Actinomycetota bacterium]
MFKRLFWLSVGLSIGYGTSFWLVRTVRRTVERFTPDRLSRDVMAGARSFGAELKAALEEGRAAMREREAELRAEIERRTR